MECNRIDELPDGGKVYVYNIDGVENRFPMPPEGFDALTATDEQLRIYGIPPRPNKDNADDYLSWVEVVDGYDFKPTPEINVLRHQSDSPSSSSQTKLKSVATDTTNIWSGYVSKLSTDDSQFYTQAQIDYIEPTISSVSGVCKNSYWVGIGGYYSESLIQAGTETEGTGTHYAWYEYLGKHGNGIAIKPIPEVSVHAGDKIHVYISFQAANNLFNWYIANSTTGEVKSALIPLDADIYFDGSSVEWIVERTSHGVPYNLGNYGSLTLTNCKAMLNTSNSWTSLGNLSNIIAVTMTSNGSSSGRVLSYPGSIYQSDQFTCYWRNYQ